jgi:hypothetical protein
MSEDKKSFTVKDRRHFTADGEARGDDQDEAPSPPEVPSAPGAEPSPPAPRVPSPPEAAPPPPPAAPSAQGVDFGAFIVSLGAQCGFLLSPEEGGPHLDEARQLISILEMLHDKTEGRRTPREDQVLSQVLYELRMAYVARSPKGAP